MPFGDSSRRFPDDDEHDDSAEDRPGPAEGPEQEREPGPVPVNEGPEEWDEAADGDDEAEISPQPDDPNGVSRDMATVVLNPGMLEQSRPAGAAGAVLGPAEWRAMSDAEIMLRVREGDDSGFDFLIEKYRKPIINFMYRMVHNQAEAEELAQEVFLRVYRSRQTYRAEAKFTTWLYRIATNLGVNHARDTKHERAAQTVYLDQPDPETGTTP
ncbi:MAG: sigma-70 family RNA polymerase sigma factor, partial [Acidobacteriaceae bacterium]